MSQNYIRNLFLMDDNSKNQAATAMLTTMACEEEAVRRSKTSRRRGSISGHAVIQRNRVQGNERIYHDYFSEIPVYPPHLFRRRFRMNRPLFFRIQSAVEAYDPYIVQKRDAAGVVGLSSIQKITATLRMLTYEVPTDSVDDYIRIGESTAIESLKRFVKAVVAIFSDEYLRSPNNNDIARLLAIGESRGFPSMLGSVDCMHWKWKNCPTAWHGMYSGHIHEPTNILEAVASYDLWIWHAFFGLPRSLNDINVLERSTIFNELAEGRAPLVNYPVNGHEYKMGYYLTDGIYPSWSTFVKTIPCPQGNKKKHFAAAQESARKDVERAFGVLQAHFAIVRGPAPFWDQKVLKNIMTACIIVHNMIVEDEKDASQIDFTYDAIDESSTISISHEHTPELAQFMQTHYDIRKRNSHCQL